MHIRVKICGVRSSDQVLAAVSAGADAVGFVLTDSPREVSLGAARELMGELPPFVTSVAVLRNPDRERMLEVAAELGPHILQTELVAGVPEDFPTSTRLLPVLHDCDSVIGEAMRLKAELGDRIAGFVLEGPGRGGRGVPVDRARAAELGSRVKLVLAGGLTPHNVGSAILEVRPYAVDVSSGVESSPGNKSRHLINDFVNSVRRSEWQLAGETNL